MSNVSAKFNDTELKRSFNTDRTRLLNIEDLCHFDNGPFDLYVYNVIDRVSLAEIFVSRRYSLQEITKLFDHTEIYHELITNLYNAVLCCR